jgi:hypothetical protein
MIRPACALVLAGLLAAAVRAQPGASETTPALRLAADDPAWAALAAGLRRQTSVTADFTERRWFAFKAEPTVLRGEARVSESRGLSLHYLAPDEQITIVDRGGVLLRSADGERAPPADPRGLAADFALLQALRLDLPALANTFELYGRRAAGDWTLVLVPRDPDLRRNLGQITVEGRADTVRRIELRRSAKQRVEILLDRPRPARPFTADELRRYFR